MVMAFLFHVHYLLQQNDFRKPLATTEKHRSVREKADKAYRKNANRMKLKHAKQHKVKDFRVGECVSVRVPRIDRASTDPQRLPCVVVEVVGKSQAAYRLRCKSGVLKVCYHAGDLEAYSGSYGIPVIGWKEAARVSLREAAKQSAPWNVFTGNRCNCSGACDTQRCPCKKKGIDCSSFCHNGKDCKNKKYDPSQSTFPSPSLHLPSEIRVTSSNLPKSPPPSSSPLASSTPIKIESSSKPDAAEANQAAPQKPTKPCHCRTRCNSRKGCPCKSSGFVCSKTCHPGHSCTNANHASSRQLTITDLTKKEGSNTDAQQKCTEWITCCGVKLYEKHKHILSSRSA